MLNSSLVQMVSRLLIPSLQSNNFISIFIGAHSWVRKSLNIVMEGEQTDYIWGVVDLTPDTDFPDIRNRCAIHSSEGSCMIIPREGDKVRLYIQLDDKNVHVTSNGRIDKNKLQPTILLEVRIVDMSEYHGTHLFTIFAEGAQMPLSIYHCHT